MVWIPAKKSIPMPGSHWMHVPCTASATADGLHVKSISPHARRLAPGIGASAALLPINIHHDGERLDVRLYADQARGPDAKSEARRVRWFEGWAAFAWRRTQR
jgi:hypothetical protein